ncbi:hypothetical protein Pelo_10717 [Pelomyxa schiedti]|nr:hypothetical protein Pelo_10707 [Pelomyxa schiedti]KAH3757492.1 hypothetical protein Pelo_10717 [Pelomyxa schiedti]
MQAELNRKEAVIEHVSEQNRVLSQQVQSQSLPLQSNISCSKTTKSTESTSGWGDSFMKFVYSWVPPMTASVMTSSASGEFITSIDQYTLHEQLGETTDMTFFRASKKQYVIL